MVDHFSNDRELWDSCYSMRSGIWIGGRGLNDCCFDMFLHPRIGLIDVTPQTTDLICLEINGQGYLGL